MAKDDKDDNKIPTPAQQAKQGAKVAADNDGGGDPLRDPKDDYQKSGADPVPDKDRKGRISDLREEQSDLAGRIATAAEKRAQGEAEYQDLVRQAAENNARLTQMVGQPMVRPTTVVEFSKQAEEKGAKMVRVYVPKSFQHRLDDHSMIDVGAGMREVPETLANHWWFAANGVAKAA